MAITCEFSMPLPAIAAVAYTDNTVAGDASILADRAEMQRGMADECERWERRDSASTEELRAAVMAAAGRAGVGSPPSYDTGRNLALGALAGNAALKNQTDARFLEIMRGMCADARANSVIVWSEK